LKILLITMLLLPSSAFADKLIVANNTRLTYDYGSDIKPYIANEVKFIRSNNNSRFDANKFRLGFRYKINQSVRLDPHIFVDNKLKDNWAFGFGPALRLDITY
jgi:hypothetical protein